MARWGRRGSIPWVFEVLISLILLALSGYAMFEFIASNARGEGFFSRYHSADIASIAQLAAAPQGDVVIRYDNLRDDLDLGFWFTNGRVAVGVPRRGGGTGLSSNRQPTLPPSFEEPETAAIGRYAPVVDYRISAFDSPGRLVITRHGPTIAILDAVAARDACPLPAAAQVPLADAKAWLWLTGALTPSERDEAIAAFRGVIGATRIGMARNEEDATVSMRVTLAAGEATMLWMGPSSADAAGIACDFAQQLRILTLEDVVFTAPSVVDGPVVADVTLTAANDDRIGPSQIGRAAAYAIARRYR